MWREGKDVAQAPRKNIKHTAPEQVWKETNRVLLRSARVLAAPPAACIRVRALFIRVRALRHDPSLPPHKIAMTAFAFLSFLPAFFLVLVPPAEPGS